MDDKKNSMLEFWSERAKRFGADPRANTNDIWLREIEIGHVQKRIEETGARSILDFGCANGYSTIRLAQTFPDRQFVGVDINTDMIAAANARVKELGVKNISFSVVNIVAERFEDTFDFIFTVRVFQNMENEGVQREVLDKLVENVAKGGHLLLVETYAEGYARLNANRAALGLPSLPMHPHLTFLPESFDDHVKTRLAFVESVPLSSTYYMVTRLLYSYIAKQNGEPIDYNHPIHQAGALLPQEGDHGPQRAGYYRKTASR